MRVLGIDPGLRITGYGCLEGHPLHPTIIEAGVIRLVGGSSRAGGHDVRTPKTTGPAEELAAAVAGVKRRRISAASVSARLLELERDVCDLLERLKPDAVAVEQMFAHAKHPGTVIVMAHARGVLLLCIKRSGLPLVELRPTEVKKALTGHGLAGKEQMQRAVQSHFGLESPPSPPDVADAIAIALCAMRRSTIG